MAKNVAIFGGGVGGLSAAHELLERGFTVRIYERQSIPGGKARSFPFEPTDEGARAQGAVGTATRQQDHQRIVVNDDATARAAGRPGLPGEHGFRFFPGFYRHITELMQRIPRLDGKGTVADDLVSTRELGIARNDGDLIRLPTHFPRRPKEIRKLIEAVDSAETGLTYQDLVRFTAGIWQIMTSSEARRVSEYERIGWWRFIDGDNQTPAFRRYFGNLTRSLVAAQPHLASTRTNGDILVQLIIDIFNPRSSADRVLNGPTNEVWIHPWIQHLKQTHGQRFEYFLDTTVSGFDYDLQSNRIRGATIETSLGADAMERIIRCDRHRAYTERVLLPAGVEADYFIAAIPIERMAPLVTAEMEIGDPNLRWLKYLESSVEWMNGIVYFLKEDVPIAEGHVLYLDPKTALTSISQAQFWQQIDIASYAPGDVGATLSVDVSDWNELLDEDLEDIPSIIWEQLKQSLNVNGTTVLADDNLKYQALDPSIQELHAECRKLCRSPDRAGMSRRQAKEELVHQVPRLANAEPLLVNTTDSWRLRPYPDSRIHNLFLASDYVRTKTDLATMESANEAARRAVNAILHYESSSAKRVKVWPLRQVWFLAPLRWWDGRRFDQGLPWQDPMPWLPSIVPPLWRLARLVFGARPARQPGEVRGSGTIEAAE